MTSPRDPIRARWADGGGPALDLSDDANGYLRGLLAAKQFLDSFDQDLEGFDRSTVRSLIRGMTAMWQAAYDRLTAIPTDPGVGVADVARKGKASDVDTPAPATPDFPPEWIAEHGSGVDL